MSSPPRKEYFKKGFLSFDNSAINIILNPINELRQVIITTGETISQTGEYLFPSSPIKNTLINKNTTTHLLDESGNFDKAVQEEKKEDAELFIIKRPSIRSSQFLLPPSSTPKTVIDIRPCFDGTKIELVVDDRYRAAAAAVAVATDDENILRLKSPHIRGSMLLFDPIAASAGDEIISMSVKILQAKNLPFDNTKIRICILNREGAVDQIIGCTPSSEGSRNPLFGSQACSWKFKGKLTTKILLTLESSDQGKKNKTQGKTKKGKPRISATVSASDLLNKTNPNFWLKMKDQNEASSSSDLDADRGRVQIRLHKPSEAILHEQENCYRITAGPAIALPRVQSYAIRKMAMYSCSPVTLNVYDVSNNSKIETINNTMKPFGYGGIFHAAIEIHGKEYSFGGTLNKRSNVSGIFPCMPKQCPMHNYRESVFLGDCELDDQQVQSILKVLRPKWMARTYNVFRKNCAFFSREFAIELGVGDLPEWVYSLAMTAESIEPYIQQLNAYLKNRTNVENDSSAAKSQQITPPATKDPSKKASAKKKKVDIATNAHMDAQLVAKNTQETLLDHAMAAKIQRSFRHTKSKRAMMYRAKTLRHCKIQNDCNEI